MNLSFMETLAALDSFNIFSLPSYDLDIQRHALRCHVSPSSSCAQVCADMLSRFIARQSKVTRSSFQTGKGRRLHSFRCPHLNSESLTRRNERLRSGDTEPVE